MLQRFNVFIITLLILIVSVPVQTMAADEITWASATDSGSTGSVTGKTSYLINNDVNSTSGKNQKAKELGIPIISEEQFMKFIR